MRSWHRPASITRCWHRPSSKTPSTTKRRDLEALPIGARTSNAEAIRTTAATNKLCGSRMLSDTNPNPIASFLQILVEQSGRIRLALVGGILRGVEQHDLNEIGRASCRERVCQVRVDLGGRSIIKKKKKSDN